MQGCVQHFCHFSVSSASILIPGCINAIQSVLKPISGERAILENPQIFQNCKLKTIFPLMMARAQRRPFQIVPRRKKKDRCAKHAAVLLRFILGASWHQTSPSAPQPSVPAGSPAAKQAVQAPGAVPVPGRRGFLPFSVQAVPG